ncbi:MAG: polysaccharide deacetylase family protein [Gemmataceae bacterium]|nr:polysaccharide deacetylase family protein [Gemmataceae bacterium]
MLTFDDGPHPEHTPAVLERLDHYGVRATFFVVGKRVTAPESLDAIRGAGHALGNHTHSHASPVWSDIALSRADVRRCQDLIPDARFFRPPLGKLTPGLWLAARSLGLECVHWTLDSGDWRCLSEADAQRCAREVLELVQAGDIVLFHDDHRWIGPILDVVLPALADRHLLPSTKSTTQHPRP